MAQCYSRTAQLREQQGKRRYDYTYYTPNGRQVTDQAILTALKQVKIPPTYTDVTVCPNAHGRVGIGYDSTGSKQSFYSSQFKEHRRQEKFCNLIALGHHINQIQADIARIITNPRADPLTYLTAIALRLMLLCNFRVGNTANRDKYGTYGLTTITGDHVQVNRRQATFKFNGKKNMINSCVVTDDSLVDFFTQLVRYRDSLAGKQEIPLLSVHQDGITYTLTPNKLNRFLQRYHPKITTRTWRTWVSNIEWINCVLRLPIDSRISVRRKACNQANRDSSMLLHHSPHIGKQSYLVGELLDLYVNQPDDWVNLVNQGKSDADNIFKIFLQDLCQE